MTVQLSATFTGAKLVRQGLQSVRRAIPRIGRKGIYDTFMKVRKILRRYPPQPSGSKYVRTYKLKRGWKVVRAGDRGYRLINRARFRGRGYAKWVVGNARGEMQARVNVHWPIMAWVVEKELTKLPPRVAAQIKRVSKGVGF